MAVFSGKYLYFSTQKIGIRKVLGAGVLSITNLLIKEFVWLVVIANLIAAPIVWYTARQWLQNFAFRMDVRPVLLLETLAMAVFVTILAVSFHSVRAATSNPFEV